MSGSGKPSRLRIRDSDEYERDFKLLKRRGEDVEHLLTVVQVLASGQALDEAYRDHALHGEWAGFRECHIEPDFLLVYKVEGGTLNLVRAGTHAELFRSWRGR